jgi:sec-independent protein translocase protein TatA
MGTFSIWHWLILLVVVLVLFGGSNKISNMMGDVAKGIKSFKRGLQDDDSKPADSTVRTIDHDTEAPLKTEVKREAQG